MYSITRAIIREDRKLQLFLALMFVMQIVFCIVQLGVYQLDQHFQVIEFSQYQLDKPSSATTVWELAAMIRPTLQVYLFSGYDMFCDFIGITSQFTKLTISRVIVGIVMFVFFNMITIYYLRNEQKKVLYFALFILNITWCYPYIRTLFSSEMMSSLFFFLGLVWYDVKKEQKQSFLFTLFIGFIFSIAFYFRFQMAFGILGFGIWMLLFEKKYYRILPLAIGFLIGVGINIYLDSEFYNRLIFTPYRYYYVNIVEGKAATFGTSSFLVYIRFLLQALLIPPLSIILLYYVIKSFIKRYDHPFVLPIILFIVGHCFIGHKEERFMFPILMVLPIIVSWTITDFFKYYRESKKWIRYGLNFIIVLSVVLNGLLYILFTTIPYTQNIHFARVIKEKIKDSTAVIYCQAPRTPLGADLKFTYYEKEFSNIKFDTIDLNSLREAKQEVVYYTVRFKDIKNNLKTMDSLGYKPIFYSSDILWKYNLFAQPRKLPTIHDIWVMYKRE